MSEDEHALAVAAEAGIHRLAIPTPFQVGRINAYLIEDSPLTLVDSGPNSAKALDELVQALAARGHAIEDIELLVITHQHIDHFGLTASSSPSSTRPSASKRSMCPSTSDSVRNACVTATLPHSSWAISWAVRGSEAIRR